MASIIEKKNEKEVVTFQFRTCVGREENGKQIIKSKTWYAAPELSLAKARKMAQVEAGLWEKEVREEFNSQDVRTYLFEEFVNEVWYPSIADGTRKHTTVNYYTTMLKVIVPYYNPLHLHNVNERDITSFLQWLRNTRNYSEKNIKHYYIALNNIFNYAYRNVNIKSDRNLIK